MSSTGRPISYVWLVMAVVALQACSASPRQQAQRDLVRQLEARRQRQAESQRLLANGLASVENGQLDRAQRELNDAVEADDRNADAWLALGVVRFRRGEPYDSALALDRAARLAPQRYEPAYNLGILYEHVGLYAPAIHSYEAALAIAPDQVEVMENLARVLIRTNQQSDRAGELIDRAMDLEQRLDWRTWLEQQQLRLANRRDSNAPQ